MAIFKKSESITGKYKELIIIDGQFADPESGEAINVIEHLANIYGDQPFSLSTSSKVDVDLD